MLVSSSVHLSTSIKKVMFVPLLITAAALSSPVLSAELTCHQPDKCPDSPVCCECRDAQFLLIWSVTSINSSMLYEMTYRYGDLTGEVRVDNGYTSVLRDGATTSEAHPTFTSKLNFTLTSSLQVGCADNVHSNRITLWKASSPSSPVNLSSSLILTATNSFAVRLDWDPPLNDGGAAITNYLIFVNMSQQVVSTNTTTTLTLNSTGQHLIEISAVNECGLVGANASSSITADELKEVSTAAYGPSNFNQLQIIVIGTSLGLLLFIVALCIVVSTVLIKTKRRKHPKTSQQEPAVPRCDRQLNPTVVISEYSLLDALNGADPEQDDFGAGADSAEKIMYTEVTSGQETFIAARNDVQYAELKASGKPASEDVAEPKYDNMAFIEGEKTAGQARFTLPQP